SPDDRARQGNAAAHCLRQGSPEGRDLLDSWKRERGIVGFGFYPPLGFRRRKENQHHKLFGDVVEAMFHFGRYKDYTSWTDGPVLGAHAHARPAAHHVVHLIFFVGFLRISAAGW